MTDIESAASSAGAGLRPAFAASRAQLGLVVVLFALAGAGWWWTAGQMRGMDNGPWTGLGTFGWFLGVWVVMMAAMMFPSVAPTVALYCADEQESRGCAAGVHRRLPRHLGRRRRRRLRDRGAPRSQAAGGDLAWDSAGRPIAGATLIVAAVYELTPLKNVCLGKCRSPLGTLLGSWRDGWSGALRMGARNGAWCVGCCWALMASLFALGVMSVIWMAVVAGLIAVEKILPWRRAATYGTALVLLALGVLVLVAPDALPGLTVPGHDSMSVMTPMGH